MTTHYMQVAATPTSEDWIEPYMETVPQLVEKHGGSDIAQATEYDRLEASGENAHSS